MPCGLVGTSQCSIEIHFPCILSPPLPITNNNHTFLHDYASSHPLIHTSVNTSNSTTTNPVRNVCRDSLCSDESEIIKHLMSGFEHNDIPTDNFHERFVVCRKIRVENVNLGGLNHKYLFQYKTRLYVFDD